MIVYFPGQLLPTVLQSSAWGMLHTLLEMFSFWLQRNELECLFTFQVNYSPQFYRAPPGGCCIHCWRCSVTDFITHSRTIEFSYWVTYTHWAPCLSQTRTSYSYGTPFTYYYTSCKFPEICLDTYTHWAPCLSQTRTNYSYGILFT